MLIRSPVLTVNYNHHVSLLTVLDLSSELLLESVDPVESAVGILQIGGLHCIVKRSGIAASTIWRLFLGKTDEEEIINAVSELGPVAMPILSRIQPPDIIASKNAFISAVQFAMSFDGASPPFGDDLKTSAQEQVEYMLGADEHTPLVTADDEVKSVVRMGLSKVCSSFKTELSSMLLESDLTSQTIEGKALQSLHDIEWMCNILPRMDLMKDFVCNWAEISGKVLEIVEDKKPGSAMLGLKVKLIEVTGKVLETVGYGNVILPALGRLQLLNSWLPFIRKIKVILDTTNKEQLSNTYKMEEEMWGNIEGAIVSLVLALPSNDQANVFADWIKTEHVRYPDLSEAFEIWCYRTKSAKRRLLEGSESVGNATVSL